MQINSKNAILMNLESAEVLFDKNGTTKMFPASLTKIMTAVIALENLKDLDEKIVLNPAMFQPLEKADASTAGFLPNENVRAIDLLYGLILPSGAECAIGLAEHLAGSETAFVKLMNDKARELGMTGTNYTNTTGLHNKNLYSTVMDVAVLFKYALANETFYKIVTTPQYSTPATNLQENGITFSSTMFNKMTSPEFDGGRFLGGKTGFTNNAGYCLASLAIKNGVKYILVTTGATAGSDKKGLHIRDAFSVYGELCP